MSPTASQEAEAAEALKRGDAAESSGDTKGAIAIYKGLSRDYSLTAAAAKAQFKTGQIQEREGDLKTAYQSYSDYVSKHPRGGDFDTVIQSQFNIAKAFLDGKKKKVLGMSFSPSFETAEEMFSGIVKRAPFHKLAPLSQFNVGQALEKQGKPAEALGAYQEVIIRYPGDPVADDAQYQIGYVRYHETKTGSNDQAARYKARESFEDFVNRYPGSEKTPQAKENIKSLSGADVKGSLDIAKFYDKQKNYKAAVVYYNEVIRVAPGTPESDQSRKRIDELKGLVGADALRTGPEKAQSGDMALARRRAQARVDVASRPDYNGPAIAYPYPATGGRPAMRTTPVGPIVEPALPAIDPLQGTPGAPGTTTPPSPDPLISPNLPPPPTDPAAPIPFQKEDAAPAPAPLEKDEAASKKSPTPAQ